MELRLKQEDASSQATQSKACYYKSIVVKRYVWATESKNAEEQSRKIVIRRKNARAGACSLSSSDGIAMAKSCSNPFSIGYREAVSGIPTAQGREPRASL
jgi:hypothetical protein